MARRRCFYSLIIICPYLLMILLFYQEIEHAENSRKAGIQNFLQLHSESPSLRMTYQSLSTANTSIHTTTQFNVLRDKHVNKNPRSSFKKPELAKINVKIKAKSNGTKNRGDSNNVKVIRGQGPNHVANERLKHRKEENQDKNILLGGQLNTLKSRTKTTTPRYQVPKPFRSVKNCYHSTAAPVWTHNYGFYNISNIHVFSVFYDNRDAPAVIRLIVLKKKADDRNLLCGFSKNGHLYIVPSEPYEMCENHDKFYGGWILSCAVPPQIKAVPCHVYVSFSVDSFRKKHKSSVLKMNITMATKDTESPRKDFGICVPPIFDDVSIISLVQFIELSKLLGASDFTFYHTKTSPSDVDKVLEYYQKKGEITVIPWILPGNMTEKVLWYFGQILAIEDCLYRNMARFKYLVFNDLDEFIIPQNSTTWSEMLEEIISKSNQSNETINHIAGYSFKSAFFSPNQPVDGTYKVRFLQYLYRTKTFSSLRTKVIVKPENIFELGIHHISRPIKDAVTIPVKPNTAFIHHYRPCSSDYDNEMKCHPTIEDSNLLKYASVLQSNYLRIMDEIASVLYGMR